MGNEFTPQRLAEAVAKLNHAREAHARFKERRGGSMNLQNRFRTPPRPSPRAFRVRLTLLIALIAATVTLALGLTCRTTPPPDRKAALVAATEDAPKECVTGWALLSMFREYFRRGKSGKKKEDE